MMMYDKFIVDLLRRQRFGEAQDRMEEALGLHMEAVQRYSQILAAIERQSPVSGIVESYRNPRRPFTRQSLSDLQRDKNFHHLYQHRSRQYLRRWCRLFISLGSRHMRNNPAFSAVQIPLFIQKYTSFMPRRIEYPIPTGTVHFNSGSESFNTQFVKGLALKRMKLLQYPSGGVEAESSHIRKACRSNSSYSYSWSSLWIWIYVREVLRTPFERMAFLHIWFSIMANHRLSGCTAVVFRMLTRPNF